MQQFERAELDLECTNPLRLLGDRLRLRAVLRLRRLTARLPINLSECICRELAEYEAGDEKIGGDTLVDVSIVVDIAATFALLNVGQGPTRAAAGAICKQCSRACWHFARLLLFYSQ